MAQDGVVATGDPVLRHSMNVLFGSAEGSGGSRRWLRRVKKAEKVKEVEKAAPDTKAMKAMKVKKAEKASKASPATKAIDKALDTLGDTRRWSDDKVLGHEARKHCRQAIKHCRKVIKALEALVDE